MVRILYIVSTLKRSGPTNVLFNLIAELDRNKFEPIILTLSPEETKFPSSKDAFFEMGVQIHSLHFSRIQGFLFSKKKIREFICRHNINVIHISGFRGDLLVGAKDFKDITIISTIHSNIYDDYTMLYGKRKGNIMARMHINSLKGKTGVACSQFVADKLKERYNVGLDVIYNGINKKYYDLISTEEKAQIIKQLKLPADKRIFIFIGSLIYRKDPFTVIRGFLDNKDLKNTYLILLGDGPLMEKCKDLCKDHMGNVKFFGNQPEPLKFLAASDYYIAGAYSEGLPMSVMEAMGCGLPVVLSDIDPHKELLKKINNWQYTFPVNRADALSAKINNLLQDDYHKLSSQCRHVIDNHVNSEIMTQNYQRLYLR